MRRLLKRLKNVCILTARQRKLILLVFWLSIYRNVLLLLKSKNAFSEHICKHQKIKIVLTAEKIAVAKDIALAIHIVNKYVPWKNVCRHQSWQALVLLLQYQIPFEYFVGIDKTTKVKEAHSWVKINDKFICGRCIEKNYHILFFKNLTLII